MVEPTPSSVQPEGGVSVLFAHHGTEGARRAEPLALELALRWRARIDHLLVVPALWGEMMGDDWLNNASTRDAFGDYLEHQLVCDAQNHLQAFRERCQALDLEHRAWLRVGEPVTCLLELARELRPVLVVIGSRRPKGVAGLRDHLPLDTVLRGLNVPLVIAPWSSQSNH
ncbi:MAG: universal stress protein [Magnetococcales bacterium]|nr:universal stress protein [Magnetococcales bacterium]